MRARNRVVLPGRVSGRYGNSVPFPMDDSKIPSHMAANPLSTQIGSDNVNFSLHCVPCLFIVQQSPNL
jgi:hypothetical protein